MKDIHIFWILDQPFFKRKKYQTKSKDEEKESLYEPRANTIMFSLWCNLTPSSTIHTVTRSVASHISK